MATPTMQVESSNLIQILLEKLIFIILDPILNNALVRYFRNNTNNQDTAHGGNMSAPPATHDESTQKKSYKLIVIGDPCVGKTALTFRFCDGRYRDNLKVTVGVDIRVKKVEVDGETITLNIWDTAGLERNRMALSSHYYRDVDAIIFVYDVTDNKSFTNLALWVKEVERETSTLANEPIKILIGNKCDKEPVVDRQKAQLFAFSHGLPMFETSAKLDSEKENIEGVFYTIAHKLKANSKLITNREAVRLSNESNPQTSQSSSCSC